MTAKLAYIFRHPIKAHGVEAMTDVVVSAGKTLPWDRRWAVLHEHAKTDGSAWAPCANFSRGAKVGTLMAIAAESDEVNDRLTLSHPDLSTLTLEPSHDGQAFLDWVAPLIPSDRAAPKKIVRVPDRGMTDTDFPSISLGSLSSLNALSDKLGIALDPRRFRANLWLKGLAPWEEFDWIGKYMELGGVRFKVAERITRCRATMANPVTGETDTDTLSALEQGWGHKDFGIYLVAETGGTLSIGDRLDGPL